MSEKIPHRIKNTYCDLYCVIGTLQGYACGLECSSNPHLDALQEGLRECAEILERVAKTFREEYDK